MSNEQYLYGGMQARTDRLPQVSCGEDLATHGSRCQELEADIAGPNADPICRIVGFYRKICPLAAAST